MYYQIHKTNYKDVYWPTTPCKKITFEFVTFVGGYWGLREREGGRVQVMLPTSKGQDIICWLLCGDFG